MEQSAVFNKTISKNLLAISVTVFLSGCGSTKSSPQLQPSQAAASSLPIAMASTERSIDTERVTTPKQHFMRLEQQSEDALRAKDYQSLEAIAREEITVGSSLSENARLKGMRLLALSYDLQNKWSDAIEAWTRVRSEATDPELKLLADGNIQTLQRWMSGYGSQYPPVGGFGGSISPNGGTASPNSGIATPNSGITSPNNGGLIPPSGIKSTSSPVSITAPQSEEDVAYAKAVARPAHQPGPFDTETFAGQSMDATVRVAKSNHDIIAIYNNFRGIVDRTSGPEQKRAKADAVECTHDLRNKIESLCTHTRTYYDSRNYDLALYCGEAAFKSAYITLEPKSSLRKSTYELYRTVKLAYDNEIDSKASQYK